MFALTLQINLATQSLDMPLLTHSVLGGKSAGENQILITTHDVRREKDVFLMWKTQLVYVFQNCIRICKKEINKTVATVPCEKCSSLLSMPCVTGLNFR